MIACFICGGLIEIPIIVAAFGWLVHLFNRKCCSKTCDCKCHKKTEQFLDTKP